MKKIIILLALVATSAFANDVQNTIYNIERDQQVRCDSNGGIEAVCSFMAIKCSRVERFRCIGSTRVIYLSLDITTYQMLGMTTNEVVKRVNYHSKMD